MIVCLEVQIIFTKLFRTSEIEFYQAQGICNILSYQKFVIFRSIPILTKPALKAFSYM